MKKTTWFYVTPVMVEDMIRAMNDRRPVQIDPPSSRAGIWYITSVYEKHEPDHGVKWVVELIEHDPADYA